MALKPYDVVSDMTTPGLAQKVNEAVALGYRPQGGIMQSGLCFYQAVYLAPVEDAPKEYIVERHEHIDQLEKLVTERIKQGWRLQGGGFSHAYQGWDSDWKENTLKSLFCQAMVK